MTQFPVEPYADGTSGHSGSETSQRRAETNDANGVTGSRQRQVYDMVAEAGYSGVTDGEAQRHLGIGHGASSSALSNLHRTGHLARLREERDGNQVYVLPLHVGERPLSEYRRNLSMEELRAEVIRLREVIIDKDEEIDALTATVNTLTPGRDRR